LVIKDNSIIIDAFKNTSPDILLFLFNNLYIIFRIDKNDLPNIIRVINYTKKNIFKKLENKINIMA
jgi:hypothetical protein